MIHVRNCFITDIFIYWSNTCNSSTMYICIVFLQIVWRQYLNNVILYQNVYMSIYISPLPAHSISRLNFSSASKQTRLLTCALGNPCVVISYQMRTMKFIMVKFWFSLCRTYDTFFGLK